MTATTPDDVTTADKLTKKARENGEGQAFADAHNFGLSRRAYIATALMPACMTDGETPAEHAAAAAVRFADALLVELAK